jgi:four helix bundle protein
MNRQEMQARTKKLALRVIRLVASLPAGRVGDVLGRQLVKSGTSVGANYREACRASSRRHFVTTLEISAREADESLYWLELLSESALVKPSRLAALMAECNEIVAILTAACRTAKRKVLNPNSYILLLAACDRAVILDRAAQALFKADLGVEMKALTGFRDIRLAIADVAGAGIIMLGLDFRAQ